jgi:hypothetical protein
MKKLARGMTTLLALSGSALFAQNLVGTWQGSLQPLKANPFALSSRYRAPTTRA